MAGRPGPAGQAAGLVSVQPGSERLIVLPVPMHALIWNVCWPYRAPGRTVTLPDWSTSHGLFNVHDWPSSFEVLFTPTTLPLATSTIGEPDVPPIVWHVDSDVYRIESRQVQFASRRLNTKLSIRHE
jgi:hypothetical protein